MVERQVQLLFQRGKTGGVEPTGRDSMLLLVPLALILLTAAPTLAASIRVEPPTPERPSAVMVEGPLLRKDGDQFATKTASLGSAIVSFNSDSGSSVGGVRIGEVISRKRFSTVVPDGRRCASACALAWLAGVERFIGANAGIRFHGDGEAGTGNAIVGAYLTKMGLPSEAIYYITHSAPDHLQWLNISDAAEHGVRITLLSSMAKETMVSIPTRYGNVSVTRDFSECCSGYISYRNQQIEIISAEPVHPSLEGIFKVREGDLLVISSPSAEIGAPATYYVLLVDQDTMTQVASSKFQVLDGTFKGIQRDDDVYFDLGFEDKKKKTAIYRNGTIEVALRSAEPKGTLPKNECATVLNMIATCVRLAKCNEEGILGRFRANQTYFRKLEEMPVFTTRKFYEACTDICTAKSYRVRPARTVLCGY